MVEPFEPVPQRLPVDSFREKLEAFQQTLTAEERKLFQCWLAAQADPNQMWPAGLKVTNGVDLPPITIYTIPGCGACEQVQAFLAARGVPATMKDVMADRAAARELVQVRRGAPGAIGAFPLIVVGDQVVVGFNPGRLRQLLLSPESALEVP